MTAGFRCTSASEHRGDELLGSASTVRAFLLVEVPGPWGPDAVLENRNPARVMHELAERAGPARVRVLAIRRPHSSPDSTTVFAARADPHRPWLETATLDQPGELLDLDLAALGAGRSPGLTATGRSVFCVCTHGRHDVCCAERGRPAYTTLAEAAPEDTWEVSHIGGDRFAGNALVLPHGLYYGRVTAEAAAALPDRHRSGDVDLDRLRGRSGYPFAVQAAEVYLRREIQETRIDALELRSRSHEDDVTTALFTRGGETWAVRVHTGHSEPARTTCQALKPGRAMVHELVGISAA